MKSLDELKKLRDQAKKKLDVRDKDARYRVVVGMATCGIAAGARPVLNALVEESTKGDYSCVVTQTGCIGMCTLEPIVEVFDQDGSKTTYVMMDAAKAVDVLKKHVLNNEIVKEYTVDSVKKGA